jgi:hypothetical protein
LVMTFLFGKTKIVKTCHGNNSLFTAVQKMKSQPVKAYRIKSKIWIYKSDKVSANAKAMKGAWHFITLPKKVSAEIKKKFGDTLKKGWGSVPVTVKIKQTVWQTSIFPDKKIGCYILPLKAEVRKKEKLGAGSNVNFSISVVIKVCSRNHLFAGKGPCSVCWPGSRKKDIGISGKTGNSRRKTDAHGIRIFKFGSKE